MPLIPLAKSPMCASWVVVYRGKMGRETWDFIYIPSLVNKFQFDTNIVEKENGFLGELGFDSNFRENN